MLVCFGVGAPAFILRFSGLELTPLVGALLFGLGILSGAFLLSWAAEVAQLDISASFALALLALIALLPEYTIEAVLAWKAGASFDTVTREITPRMSLVAANVTGANRLLVGLGWSLVILIFWIKRRRMLDLRGTMSLEITVLAVATAATFLIFIMQELNIVLAAALIGLYPVFLWLTSTREAEEPELMGTALAIGSLPARRRRMAVILLLIYSAAVIVVAAEPFVEALVDAGQELGVSEFLLIQWITPLASESPEILVAVLFSLRANPRAGLITLLSAQVSQFTVLIGSMVVIFSVSADQPLSFPMDSHQAAEFFLTSSVSVFAVLLIAPRLLGWRAGVALLALFLSHLYFTETAERLIFAYIYLGMTAGLIVVNRRWVLQAIGMARA